MRLQIAITAVCSLEIYQIALNASVKDRKVRTFTIPAMPSVLKKCYKSFSLVFPELKSKIDVHVVGIILGFGSGGN